MSSSHRKKNLLLSLSLNRKLLSLSLSLNRKFLSLSLLVICQPIFQQNLSRQESPIIKSIGPIKILGWHEYRYLLDGLGSSGWLSSSRVIDSAMVAVYHGETADHIRAKIEDDLRNLHGHIRILIISSANASLVALANMFDMYAVGQLDDKTGCPIYKESTSVCQESKKEFEESYFSVTTEMIGVLGYTYANVSETTCLSCRRH